MCVSVIFCVLASAVHGCGPFGAAVLCFIFGQCTVHCKHNQSECFMRLHCAFSFVFMLHLCHNERNPIENATDFFFVLLFLIS